MNGKISLTPFKKPKNLTDVEIFEVYDSLEEQIYEQMENLTKSRKELRDRGYDPKEITLDAEQELFEDMNKMMALRKELRDRGFHLIDPSERFTR